MSAEPGGGRDAGGARDPIEPAAVERERRRMVRPLAMPAYFLARLPLAFAAGVRLRSLSAERCEVTVPFGWRTTNPFRSIYFAALAMAAELSTGALALLAARAAPGSVATLITGLRADFEKKADAAVLFTCDEGPAAFDAVRTTLATGNPATVELTTVGRLPDGAVAARFVFTWSVKRRRPAD